MPLSLDWAQGCGGKGGGKGREWGHIKAEGHTAPLRQGKRLALTARLLGAAAGEGESGGREAARTEEPREREGVGKEAARREGRPAAGSGAPRWDWFLRSHFLSNQTADLRREPTRAALEVCAWLRPMIGNRFHCRLE